MSLTTALRIVHHELELHPDNNIVFDLFGGEPFLKFNLIKSLCERVWSKYPNRQIRFSCITNGTISNPEIIEWLKIHRHHFFSHISIDGTPEMHLCNRGSSFPFAVAKTFAEIWPSRATAKMTISRETLYQVFEGVKFLQDIGLRVAPSLARGLDWNDNDLSVYQVELDKLVNYSLSLDSSYSKIDLFNTSLAPILLKSTQEKYCGAGYSMCAYTPDGKRYPCQMFMPSSLEDEKWTKIKNMDLRGDKFFYSDIDCMVCPIRNLCTKCPGLNYKEREAFGKRDKRLCSFIKSEFQAIAKYKVLKLSRMSLNEFTKSDYIELKASIKLLELVTPQNVSVDVTPKQKISFLIK